MIGMFVGTVALRLPVSPRVTFAELLATARTADLDAFTNADVPFDMVVDALGASGTEHHPLFQVMLSYENFADGFDIDHGDVTGVREVAIDTARFDLQVSVREHRSRAGTPTGMDGEFTYDSGLFDHATVAAWMPYLLRVLEVVTADAAIVVGGIDVLRPEPEMTGSQTTVASATTLPRLVAESVCQQPRCRRRHARRAVVDLRAAACPVGALAAVLVERGLGVEDVVAVALPRSLDLLVAVLAVVRAGAIYLPLDVTHPPARLAALFDDAEPAAVLCGTDFPCPTDVPMVAIDSEPVRARMNAGAAFDTAVPPAAGAYLVYTSGSTGFPKGVLVSHAAAVSLLAATTEFGFGPADVWTLFHSPAFDFSVWEMWGALTTGGRLVIVDHHIARDPGAFAALLDREQVTVLNQTPTAFAQLAPCAAMPTVRLVIFGGEALEPQRVRAWLAYHPHVHAVNMFGITETTVHVTRGAAGDVGIGVCLPGMQVQSWTARCAAPHREASANSMSPETNSRVATAAIPA